MECNKENNVFSQFSETELSSLGRCIFRLTLVSAAIAEEDDLLKKMLDIWVKTKDTPDHGIAQLTSLLFSDTRLYGYIQESIEIITRLNPVSLTDSLKQYLPIINEVLDKIK